MRERRAVRSGDVTHHVVASPGWPLIACLVSAEPSASTCDTMHEYEHFESLSLISVHLQSQDDVRNALIAIHNLPLTGIGHTAQVTQSSSTNPTEFDPLNIKEVAKAVNVSQVPP